MTPLALYGCLLFLHFNQIKCRNHVWFSESFCSRLLLCVLVNNVTVNKWINKWVVSWWFFHSTMIIFLDRCNNTDIGGRGNNISICFTARKWNVAGLTVTSPSRERAMSASTPLTKEIIQYLRDSMAQNLKFETPHVFVVFGASVAIHVFLEILFNSHSCFQRLR